jgi:hypothetical protein
MSSYVKSNGQPEQASTAKKTNRWLLLSLIALVLLGLSASGALGILMGAALLGWGIFGYKRSRRTAVELVIGRAKPTRWAACLTAGAGALFTILGIAGIAARHQEASRKAEASAAAKEQADQEQAHRQQAQASLLAAAPAKAAEWRATLKTISSDMASVKTSDDLHRKLGELTALRDQARTWLGQLDTKPPDAAAAVSEIESKSSQVQAMTDSVDGVAAVDRDFLAAKEQIAKRSWLEADQALDSALQRLTALQVADPAFRAFVVGGFDPVRKKAEVEAARAGIATAVAGAKKRQAAAEAAEQKRAAAEEAAKAAAQTYLTLCGDAPKVSSWDGALVGLELKIKETAHDPDSIDVSECTTPVLTKDNCWASTCKVRGKNAFGALILQKQTWSYSKALGFRPVS